MLPMLCRIWCRYRSESTLVTSSCLSETHLELLFCLTERGDPLPTAWSCGQAILSGGLLLLALMRESSRQSSSSHKRSKIPCPSWLEFVIFCMWGLNAQWPAYTDKKFRQVCSSLSKSFTLSWDCSQELRLDKTHFLFMSLLQRRKTRSQ